MHFWRKKRKYHHGWPHIGIDIESSGNARSFFIAVHHCDVEIRGEGTTAIISDASLDILLSSTDAHVDFNIYGIGGRDEKEGEPCQIPF